MGDVGESIGRLIAGRYRLRTRIGRGGMGVVWRARDEILGRDVAVKQVLSPPELSEAEQEVMNRRAVREARSAARLSHPGVVTVYDVVEEKGRPWVVMEFVQARSLQEVLTEDGPMPPWRAARIGRQTLSALGAAHAVGILHRDVKPGNVLLTMNDRAVLTDFGIAVIDGDITLTQTGGVLGSPAYTAPERIRGERATPASDLWALGVTLYAAVEGTPPFARTDPVAVFGAVLVDEPVPRRAGRLRPLIEGLLIKDPARRMSAGVAEALLIAVAGEGPAPSRPSGAARPGRRAATVSAVSPATSMDLPVEAPPAPPAVEDPVAEDPVVEDPVVKDRASLAAPESPPAPGGMPGGPGISPADLRGASPGEEIPAAGRAAPAADLPRPPPAPGPRTWIMPWLRPKEQPFARVAGLFAYAGAGLLPVAASLALLGGRYPGRELSGRAWPYVLATLIVLAALAAVHVVVALGLRTHDRRRASSIAAGVGVAAAAGLLALVAMVPGFVGSDREPAAALGVLWSGTGVWLGLTGMLAAVRSRAVALAGEAAAGLWILLIAAPTLSTAALAAALAGTALMYGIWAVGLGRLLRSGVRDRAVRSSR